MARHFLVKEASSHCWSLSPTIFLSATVVEATVVGAFLQQQTHHEAQTFLYFFMPTKHQYPQFFTATCLEWKHLLAKDQYKNIIIEDLKWLVYHRWVKVYCFVIMPNHLHYIWDVHPSLIYSKVKGSHLRNTAQKIKHDLITNNEQTTLQQFYVGAKDRAYQFWERNPLSVDLYYPYIIDQKFNYVHANPIRKNLCQAQEDYLYSSAEYYRLGQDRFGILTHIQDIGIWEEDPILVKSKYFGEDAS